MLPDHDPTASPLLSLLADQQGLVSRRQLHDLGLDRVSVERLLRRRLLTRVHAGVYVDHTGPLTWQQRATAAVLACAPALLGADSALRSYEGPGSGRSTDGPVHVLIDRHRRLIPPHGVVLHRVTDLARRARWNHAPPRDSFEAAVVDVALARSDRHERVAALSGAVQSRRTTAHRLLEEIDRRARVADRRWLERLLHDVADGTCSALEHGYLTRVERAHGLTGARRQVRDRLASGAVYRDVAYETADGSRLVVELDGRLHHDTAHQRDLDLERDLETAVGGGRSVRVGWGQVFVRQCRTAGLVSQLLGRPLSRCPRCPG